ncbi:MAG: CHAT domain-containing protein, partial [Cyanobacteria bacterium P01_D01_bin.44]
KILILTANPQIPDYDPLRLDAEVRRVEEALRRSRYRDRIEIVTKLAIRTTDLRRALLDHRPQIVHFSGHGTGEQGLVLENEAGKAKLVSTEALAGLFGIFQAGEIECVLLNACYSEVQATAIHQFVDCVIGMNQPIGDKPAVQFAEGFYDALGAGSDYDEAFRIGCSAIALEGSSEHSTPVLKYRKRRSVAAPGSEPAASPAPAPAASPPPAPSQSIGNITISGNHNPFNAIQSGGDVTIDQSQTRTSHPDLQAALAALGQLKDAITTTPEIDETEKAMAAIPIQKLESELQKPEPERSAVERTIATLKKALDGVTTLAEPVAKVAALVAKAWVGLL